MSHCHGNNHDGAGEAGLLSIDVLACYEILGTVHSSMLRTGRAPALICISLHKRKLPWVLWGDHAERVHRADAHRVACFRQGVWCVPHFDERRRGLSGCHSSMVHMRAIHAGDEHWLVSWCTCSSAATVAEVLFSNQARSDVTTLTARA